MEPPRPYRPQWVPPAASTGEALCPDDEGSDHANDGEYRSYHVNHRRPQHEGDGAAHHATPHGAMTSILSAAEYSPPQGGGRKVPQKEPAARPTSEESATKKALRLRASKYFHRGGATKPLPATGNAKEAGQGSPTSNLSDATAPTAPSTITPDHASQPQAEHSAVHERPPPRAHPPPTNADVPSPSSLAFFPRTSAPKRPSPPVTYEIAAEEDEEGPAEEEDPELQDYPSEVSGYHSGSDLENAARRILRGGKRRYPSPRTVEGEEEEWAKLRAEGAGGEKGLDESSKQSVAAKTGKASLPRGWRERIERKTGRQMPRMEASKNQNGTGGPGENGNEEDENGQGEQWHQDQLGASLDVSGSDHYFSSVHQAMPQSTIGNQYRGRAQQLAGHYMNSEQQSMMASAEPRYPPAHTPSPAFSEYDEVYYPEDLQNNGAFPSYPRVEGGQMHTSGGGRPPLGREHEFPLQFGPGPLPYRQHQPPPQLQRYEYRNGAIDDEGEQYYSHEEWDPDDMALGSTVPSWEDPDGTFRPRGDVAGNGQGNYHYDDQGGYQDDSNRRGFSATTINYDDGGDGYATERPFRPIAINENGFPIESRTDGPIHDLPDLSTKRVRFSSSVEGDAGTDGLDSEGFDDDEYFHRFSSHAAKESTRGEDNHASQHDRTENFTRWEPIPASPNVKWTSSARNAASSEAIPNTRTATKDERNPLAWKESENTKDGVSSMPQWKLRKLMAEQQTQTTNHVAGPKNSNAGQVRTQKVNNREPEANATSPPRPVTYTFDDFRPKPKQARQSLHALSEGELSEGYTTSDVEGGSSRKSRRGRLRFFRSRRKCNSEGERSDSEWDSSDDRSKPSFSMSPLRGRKKKKNRGYNSSKSPRRMRLFGERRHASAEPRVAEPRVYTKYESKYYDSTHQARAEGKEGKFDRAMNDDTKQDDETPVITNQNESKSASSVSQIRDEPLVVSKMNASMLSQETNESPTDTNLNDSRETQSTPLASNARGKSNNARSKPPGKPPLPRRPAGSSPRSGNNEAKIEASGSNDSQNTGTHSGSTIQAEKADDDSVSTLGSLVTKGTSDAKSARKSKHISSDMSTVSELSEIERLRNENNRLREELENASQLSSKVSSMYAESLKLENMRLKGELSESPARNSQEMMFKSTLETLLEKDNKKRVKKEKRRYGARKEVDAEEFNHLPPVAHHMMINGDFDEDSITTYSPIDPHRVRFERDADCGVAGSEFLKRTCSRARTVAVEMKSLAQDINNERRETGSCTAPIAGIFTACTRKDRNGSMGTRKKSNSSRRRNSRRAGYNDSSTVSSTSESFVQDDIPSRRGRSRTARHYKREQAKLSKQVTPVPESQHPSN